MELKIVNTVINPVTIMAIPALCTVKLPTVWSSYFAFDFSDTKYSRFVDDETSFFRVSPDVKDFRMRFKLCWTCSRQLRDRRFIIDSFSREIHGSREQQ